jgi:hypothetical protein
MPKKSDKKISPPTLYKTFVDAYMKARPDEPRAVCVKFLLNKNSIIIINLG